MDYLQEIQTLLKRYDEIVLVTMVDHRGSAPQVDGAKAVFFEGDLLWGTVGGGKVEEAVKLEAKNLQSSPEKTIFKKWNLQKDIGMTCGGEVSFFFEKLGSEVLNIAVFGAGHVAQALVPQLLKLDCRVTWVDERSEWLDKAKEHPRLKKVLSNDPKSLVSELKTGSFIISMTPGHKFDVPVLEQAFHNGDQFPYIGCIGSNQKAQVIKSDLKKLGIEERDLERLFCPIGLKFGRNIPEEIAFSIVAQIITERDNLS